MKPHVENAPGLIWRQKGEGWEAIWRARADLIKRGFKPKNRSLWKGSEPTKTEAAYIADNCRRLQDEMLVSARGGLPVMNAFDGTLTSLIRCYQTDPDSSYHQKRYAVRKVHDVALRRIDRERGATELRDINARLLKAWHREWSGGTERDVGPKVALAHGFIGHLRTLFSFGFTLLEDRECERLSTVLHQLRFPAPKARTAHLTADMVVAHRKMAHWRGWNYMALAQAIQFEGTLRQKDVVGEWVPVSEPGISDTINKGKKWISGLRWEEIDQNMILTHTTSKRQKVIVIDLKLAPMVLEELAYTFELDKEKVTRDALPASGPIILCEVTGWPYIGAEFGRKWRVVANLAGIPKTVRSMDSRAGAISEAITMGARLEHVRHAATHSDIGMTQKYDREAAQATATVMKIRTEGRNKPKT